MIWLWVLLGLWVASIAALPLLVVAHRFRSSFSSRGEEAGVPEHSDDQMAVARAVGVEPPPVDWDLLEEQFYSLEPLVERVKRVKEGRR